MNQNSYDELTRRLLMLTQSVSEACQKLTKAVDQKIDDSLAWQRRELAQTVSQDVHNALDGTIENYRRQVTESTNTLDAKIKDIEKSLEAVASKNRKLVFNSWLAVAASLLLVLVGTVGLSLYYKNIVKENQAQAELLKKINGADVTVCGDNLCAAVGKEKYGNYYIIKSR